VRTWRTSDGRQWENQGLFEWRMPRWVSDDWMISVPHWHVPAAPDRLVLVAEVVPCCGTGGTFPLGSRYASITAVYPERVPLRKLVIWTSPDGKRWTRRSNADLRDPVSGNAWITDIAGVADGVLATRASSGADGLFSSPDGSEWEAMGPLPPGYNGLGPTGLVIAQDRVVVAFDAEHHANTLEVWVREGPGAWMRTLHEPYTTANALVATGALVVASGRSYDNGLEDWPRIFVSTDGGATWDPELSWTGARGGCTRDLATDGAELVLFGCYEGAPTLWHADVPTSAGREPLVAR